MKQLFIILFLILLLLSTCSKTRGYSIDGTHTWENEDIDFYLNKEANALTEQAVVYAFDQWGMVTHFNFHFKGKHDAGLSKDGKNTVSFLTKWPARIPVKNVGYCMSWYNSSGHIIESDIIFNMQHTRFTTLKTNTPGSYYIEGVLAHEIGHLIGLAHIELETSVMKTYSPRQESFFKGRIDDDTILAYKKLYGSVDK